MLMHARFVSNESLYVYTYTYTRLFNAADGRSIIRHGGCKRRQKKMNSKNPLDWSAYARRYIRRNSAEHASAFIESRLSITHVIHAIHHARGASIVVVLHYGESATTSTGDSPNNGRAIGGGGFADRLARRVVQRGFLSSVSRFRNANLANLFNSRG